MATVQKKKSRTTPAGNGIVPARKAGVPARKAGVPARKASVPARQPRPGSPARGNVSIETRLRALGSGALEEYNALAKMVAHYETTKLSYWWNIGNSLNTVNRQWHEEGLTTFCVGLEINPTDAGLAMRLARTWSHEEVIRHVTEAAAKGQKIYWTQVRLLFLAPAEPVRDKYLEIIKETPTSVAELRRQMESEVGELVVKKRRRKGGGRKHNIQATVAGQAPGLRRESEKYSNYLNSWHDAFERARKSMTPDRHNPALLKSLQAILADLDAVRVVVDQRIAAVIGLAQEVEATIGPLAIGDAPAARALPAPAPAPETTPAPAPAPAPAPEAPPESPPPAESGATAFPYGNPVRRRPVSLK
jgi:hypothetical protein